jgi:AbrB family looped-hinge helix DNA binding protein
MPISKLTSNGRFTLPEEIRDRLQVQAGSRIDFVIDPSGRVILKPLNSDYESLCGMLRSRAKHPVSIEEMNEAIADGWAGI